MFTKLSHEDLDLCYSSHVFTVSCAIDRADGQVLVFSLYQWWNEHAKGLGKVTKSVTVLAQEQLSNQQL